VAYQAAPPAAAPPAKGKGCFGCGCGGCLVVLLILVLLLVGGGYWLFVVQAEAGVASPAGLNVIAPPVDVGRNDANYRTATSGETLNAGSSVRTGAAGKAAIVFPDGTVTRLANSTTVTITQAQLAKDGSLKGAELAQKVGRTLTSIGHLAGGAGFDVGGHNVAASVRGTKFEVLVRADSSNLIKVFEGKVRVHGGKGEVTAGAGQQVAAAADGTVAQPAPIVAEPGDPFANAVQSEAAARGGSNRGGTVQTNAGNTLATGQSATETYFSPGGNLTAVLTYAGSLMQISVRGPDAKIVTQKGPPPIRIAVAGAPPGLYTATVTGVDLPPGGETYALSWATDAPCYVPDKLDSGGSVRESLSNAQIQQSLSQSGVSGVSLQVVGVSDNSARITFSARQIGQSVSWTVDFYASPPNLGAVIVNVTVNGINVTAQVVSQLSSSYGKSIQAIPADFMVDRVYSCLGPGGGTMVVEGHH